MGPRRYNPIDTSPRPTQDKRLGQLLDIRGTGDSNDKDRFRRQNERAIDQTYYHLGEPIMSIGTPEAWTCYAFICQR